MNENGHAPAVTDLGEILDRTRTGRVLRLPMAAIRRDSFSAWELAAVGRAIGLTPGEVTEEFERREQGGWAAVELAQALAWVVLRRVEPDLRWEDARLFELDIVDSPPDPTPPVGATRSTGRGVTST